MENLVVPGISTDASDTFLLQDVGILRNGKNLTVIHRFKDGNTRF